MAGFEDAPLVGPGTELRLTIDGRAVPHDEVLADVVLVARAGARETPAGEVGEGLERSNLYAVAELWCLRTSVTRDPFLPQVRVAPACGLRPGRLT